MNFCGGLLEGMAYTAVEPDKSPAFEIAEDGLKIMHNKNYPGLVAGNFILSIPLLQLELKVPFDSLICGYEKFSTIKPLVIKVELDEKD